VLVSIGTDLPEITNSIAAHPGPAPIESVESTNELPSGSPTAIANAPCAPRAVRAQLVFLLRYR